MVEFVAIVSSFNRAELLQDALRSLSRTLEELQLRSVITVIDAGSTDGSPEVVRRMQSAIPIRLLEHEGISFAEGVNLAVERSIATETSTKYVLLFETDNLLGSAEALRSGIELLRTEREVGAVGFTASKQDGSPAGFGRDFPSIFEFMVGPQIGFKLGLDRPTLQWQSLSDFRWSRCDVVYTSPMIIRREAWEETGGFEAATFPFSDCDVDWAVRLRDNGYSQAVIRTDAVVHDNRQMPSSWSATRALHFHRARYEVLRRRYGSLVQIARPVLALRHFAELMASAALGREQAIAGICKRWALLRKSVRGYR